MQMHLSGQTKYVPISRIHHATHESIHPLTHADEMNVHGEGRVVCLFILGWVNQAQP